MLNIRACKKICVNDETETVHNSLQQPITSDLIEFLSG